MKKYLPLLLTLSIAVSCTTQPPSMPDGSGKDVVIIAHRGVPRLAPENTLTSARLAWKRGADAVEIDVRRTFDGRIVVIHDSSTLRVANMNLFIRHVTFDEIRDLDVGLYHSARYAGETIPAVEDILAAVPPGKFLYIEVKTDSSVLPELERLIRESGKADQVRILSFNTKVLYEAKKALPEVPCYLLKFHVPRHKYPALLEELESIGADGADLFHASVTPELVDLLASRGFTCITWTVDSLRTARRLASYGVSGITTNVAGWLRRRL